MFLFPICLDYTNTKSVSLLDIPCQKVLEYL